jgi:hypothetical protein
VNIGKAFKTFSSIVRDVFLAALIADPEKQQFFSIKKHYPRLLHVLSVLLCVYVAFLLFLIIKVIVSSTHIGSFIVAARTERIEYEPESLDPPRIAFRDATLYWEDQDLEAFDPSAPVSMQSKTLPLDSGGSIQLQGKTKIIFSRIGKGSLHIQIKSAGPILVFDENDQRILSLQTNIDLVLHDPGSLINNGIAWKYNLDGPLIIGRVPTYELEQSNGFLLEGEIQMVAKQLLTGNHYKVEPYKLQLGDELQFVPNNPKTSGLVTFDQDRGLLVVAIVEAHSATIKKFRETSLKLQNNLWSKLGKDEELVITWAILLTVPGFLVFITRILYFHLQMNARD